MHGCVGVVITIITGISTALVVGPSCRALMPTAPAGVGHEGTAAVSSTAAAAAAGAAAAAAASAAGAAVAVAQDDTVGKAARNATISGPPWNEWHVVTGP